MKLLVYLRFLRPLRSLALIALYTGVAAGSLSLGERELLPEKAVALFVALTVALPLLLGLFIAGAAHEPMHRPFALLLPHLRQRQRTAAGYSLLVAALATTCVVSWTFPTSTATATFGLACTLIALPCLNRHQPRDGGVFVALLVWGFFRFIVGVKLAVVMTAVPWLFFIGGLAASAACLVRGFYRESLRVRAGIRFTSLQTKFYSVLVSGRSTNRPTAETGASPLELLDPHPVTVGQDWTVRAVGADTRSWMRVFRHATFARRQRSSYLKSQLTAATVIMFYVTLVPLFGLVVKRTPFTMASYWHTLAKLGAPELGRSLNFPLLIQAGFCVLLALGFVHPQLAYPIARRRLADVVFGLSLTQLGFALILPALSVFVPCVVGQLASRHFIDGLGLPSLITLDLGLLPLLPLFACAGAARSSVRRILLVLPIAVPSFALTLTHPIWNRWIFTAPGLVLIIGTTSATLLLLRWRLRHHYSTCDLNAQPDASSLLGAHATGRG